MPSAIVFIDGSCCGRPASSEGGYAAAPAACTPTTRTSGPLGLDRDRDAGEQAAAAGRDDHGLHLGGLLEHLEPERARRR